MSYQVAFITNDHPVFSRLVSHLLCAAFVINPENRHIMKSNGITTLSYLSHWKIFIKLK